MTPKFIISVLLSLILFPGIGLSQSQKPKDDEVTPREKRVLQRLGKLFVKRYQQTRDLKPLTKEFFLNDFESLFNGSSMFIVPEKIGPQLSRKERFRAYIAEANLLYVGTLSRILTSSAEFDILSKTVAKTLTEDKYWGTFPKKNITREGFLKNLIELERALTEAHVELAKKNYEKSVRYRREIAKLETVEDFNYPVNVDVWNRGFGEGDKGEMKEWLRRFPSGTKAYHIGTPIGIALLVVKEKGKYKVFMIGPYPWD